MKRKNLIPLIILLVQFSIINWGCNQNKKEDQSIVINNQANKKILFDEESTNFYKFWAGYSEGNAQQLNSNTYNYIWGKMDSNLLSPIKNWKKTSLPQSCQSTTFLFYPFSGPDFLIPNTIFPNVKHMIMFGLEKPGKDISKKGIDFAKRTMSTMQKSLRDYCTKSYFITKNMSADLKNDTLSGVTPLIATFLVKENFKLVSIKNFKLISKGEKLYYTPDVNNKKIDTVVGVEINYTKDGKDILCIDYLSFNAEDNSLKLHE